MNKIVSIFGSRESDKFMNSIEKRLNEQNICSVLRQKLPSKVTEDELSNKGVLYASFELINKSDVLIFIDGSSDKLLIELGYAYAKNKYIIGIKDNLNNISSNKCFILCDKYINRNPIYILRHDSDAKILDKYGYTALIANEISEYLSEYFENE